MGNDGVVMSATASPQNSCEELTKQSFCSAYYSYNVLRSTSMDTNNGAQPRLVVSLRFRVSCDSQCTHENTILPVWYRSLICKLGHREVLGVVDILLDWIRNVHVLPKFYILNVPMKKNLQHTSSLRP